MLIWTLAMCLWLHTNTAQNSYGREEPAYPGWEEDGLGLAEDISLTPLSKDSAPFLNLTVQAGATATLTCAFNEITEKTTTNKFNESASDTGIDDISASDSVCQYLDGPRVMKQSSEESLDWINHCAFSREADRANLYSVTMFDSYLGFDSPLKAKRVRRGGAVISKHCFNVSWLRRQEGQLRLLSVGLEIYSRDSRYTFQRSEDNYWQLTVAGVQETDQGLYECQVTSHPPLAYSRYLHVTVPELKILDERGLRILSKFYNAGSTLELKCLISRVPRPQHFILWVHGNRILNFDTTRGGISVKSDIFDNGVKSSLFIANASPLDSGNYTCSLAGVGETTVAVHVIIGETPAAMQHGTGTLLSSSICTSLFTILFSLWEMR
ncbi:hypothetical protein J6590_040303 [Homalodisca vitripennis]|nr:hypothetical protein J6590_040303 [Homalodisca vitripennis]